MYKGALAGESTGDCAARLPLSVGKRCRVAGVGSVLSISSGECAESCVPSCSGGEGREGGADQAPFWLFCMAGCVKKSVRPHDLLFRFLGIPPRCHVCPLSPNVREKG